MAVEAVRRTIARVLPTVCGLVEAKLAARAATGYGWKGHRLRAGSGRCRKPVRKYSCRMGRATRHRRRATASHEHAARPRPRYLDWTDLASGGNNFGSPVAGGPEDIRAGELYVPRSCGAPPRLRAASRRRPADRLTSRPPRMPATSWRWSLRRPARRGHRRVRALYDTTP